MNDKKIFEDRYYSINSNVRVDYDQYGKIKEIIVPNYEYRIELENHTEIIVNLDQIKGF